MGRTKLINRVSVQKEFGSERAQLRSVVSRVLNLPRSFQDRGFTIYNKICSFLGLSIIRVNDVKWEGYSTVQYSTVQYSTVQYSTVQYKLSVK